MKNYILPILLLLSSCCTKDRVYKSISRNSDGKSYKSELILKSDREFLLSFEPEYPNHIVYYSYGKYMITRNKIQFIPQKKDYSSLEVLKRKHKNTIYVEVFGCGGYGGGDAIYDYRNNWLGETDEKGLFTMKRTQVAADYSCVFFSGSDSLQFRVSSERDSSNYYKISKSMEGCYFFSMNESESSFQKDTIYMGLFLNNENYDVKFEREVCQ